MLKLEKIFITIFAAFIILMPLSAEAGCKIGVVLSIGGLNDGSFNDAAYKGIVELRKNENCLVEIVEPADISGIEPAIDYLCSRNNDLICAIGIFANDPMRSAAAKFPDKKFLLIDSVVTAPNVLSILFDEEQGSFYAGAFAGLVTKTKTAGFLGGMDSPVIAAFERGFRNGLKFVDPEITLTSRYIGSTPDSFNMPDKARILSISMANDGADFIYHAAGKSGLGLIDASRRNDFLVIGVDSDQSKTAPGRVAASMVKRIDTALIKAVQMVKRDCFEGGIWTLGLAEGGVELALSKFNKDLFTPEVKSKLKEIEDFLIHTKH